MPLFDNDTRTGLERLIDHADIRYSRSPEALAIWSRKGETLDDLRAGLQRAIDSFFIRNADGEALDEWERFLEIKYQNPHPGIDFRRSTVAAVFIPSHHIGEPEIRALIAKYTPNAVSITFDRGLLSITVEESFEDEYAVLDAIQRRIPAHLGLKMRIHVVRRLAGVLPIGYAGANGVYMTPDFPQHRLTIEGDTDISQGGAVHWHADLGPVSTATRLERDVHVANAGAAAAHAQLGPVTATFRAEADTQVLTGSAMATRYAIEPTSTKLAAASAEPSLSGATVAHTRAHGDVAVQDRAVSRDVDLTQGAASAAAYRAAPEPVKGARYMSGLGSGQKMYICTRIGPNTHKGGT